MTTIHSLVNQICAGVRPLTNKALTNTSDQCAEVRPLITMCRGQTPDRYTATIQELDWGKTKEVGKNPTPFAPTRRGKKIRLLLLS
jgi:hypothetical protein